MDAHLRFIFRHKNPVTGEFREVHARKISDANALLFADGVPKSHLVTLGTVWSVRPLAVAARALMLTCCMPHKLCLDLVTPASLQLGALLTKTVPVMGVARPACSHQTGQHVRDQDRQQTCSFWPPGLRGRI